MTSKRRENINLVSFICLSFLFTSFSKQLLEKKGDSKKKKNYNMGYSYLVTQPSTNPAQQGLTSLSGQNMFLSLWYSNSTLNAYVKFLG